MLKASSERSPYDIWWTSGRYKRRALICYLCDSSCNLYVVDQFHYKCNIFMKVLPVGHFVAGVAGVQPAHSALGAILIRLAVRQTIAGKIFRIAYYGVRGV